MKDLNIIKAIRWTARIAGSSILAFVLFFLLAHLFGNEEPGEGFRNTSEVISFLFFPISTVIGLALALKWDGLGGLIATLGMIGLFILRPDLILSIFLVILIPGLLYLVYWGMNKMHNV